MQFVIPIISNIFYYWLISVAFIYRSKDTGLWYIEAFVKLNNYMLAFLAG